MKIDQRKKNGGARPNSGPAKKEYQLGDEPRNTTLQVEPSVIKICREKYGSMANALRFAAKIK